MSKLLKHEEFCVSVEAALREVQQLLVKKNVKYGNSALEPSRIFSKANAHEQLLVRIDDKLNRIKNWGKQDVDEDTLLDLMGYLVLLRINMKHETGSNDIRGHILDETNVHYSGNSTATYPIWQTEAED